MKSKMKLLAAATIVVLAAAGLAAQVIDKKLCCVAGEYSGSHVLDQLPNCPVPEKESFTLTMYQAKECSADVQGKIVDASGHVSEFKGTLGPGSKGCCTFKASFSDPQPVGHIVEMKGTICKVGGKWQAKGTYTETNSGDPCKKTGTWQFQQI